MSTLISSARQPRLWCACACAALLAACGGKPAPAGDTIATSAPATTSPPPAATAPATTTTPETNAPATTTTPETNAPVPAAEPAPTPAEAPPLPEADVRALVARWLEAQNHGDFGAYSEIYAPKMLGIKRAGARMTKFDREHWLADRKRMFARVMQVEANDVKVRASAYDAVVTLMQTWESGTFRDVGEKQLVVVREAGGLRIAREEMLASQLEAARAEASGLTIYQYTAVLRAGGLTGVVVKAHVDPELIPHGPTRGLERGHSAWARVTGQPAEKLTLELFDADGKACETPGGEWVLVARADPHFGTLQTWDGTSPDVDEPRRLSDAQVAVNLFEVAASEGTHEVVRYDDAACPGAVWGRVKDGTPAAPLRLADTAPLADRALAELRKLPVWKARQAEMPDYDDTKDLKGPWDEVAFDRTSELGAWQAADGTVYLSLEVHAGEGCGNFEGWAWAVWKIVGQRWTLLTDRADPGDTQKPAAAADLDGDGLPELIAPESLVQPVDKVWRATFSIRPPNYDCGC